MINGMLPVFRAGSREFCLAEMVREACRQYANHGCTLDEFMDEYEAIVVAAAESEAKRGGCGGAAAYA